MEGDTSLPAKDSRLHIDTVILGALLEALDIPLELHLLRLEVVTGVILIATGHGDDIQGRQSRYRLSLPRA